ncbi:metal ABC transporter solute-binding protein, Zn/Mn family [Aquibacillus sediminis]|uniref:metal ABC transporter solute-binding protein, Zn/Mn family n=1 Tax=Aquibacillus sediminis TaxID=2574734 RepID=UPI00110861DE|nr:zinc ABC transporter substrate-binding protein [Aquibacillus sediminis]
MINRKSIFLALLLSSFLIIITACGETTDTTTSQEEESQLPETTEDVTTIYTTIYPIEYMVERIGGEEVQVTSVYPPGVDAHSYEPTSKMMTNIAEANAFIYLGGNLEAIAETAADALNGEEVKLIELGTNEHLFSEIEIDHEDVEEEHNDQSHEEEHDHETDVHDHETDEHGNEIDEHDGHDHGDHDPHIWLDPIRAIDMAHIIKDELIELVPDQAEIFEENYATLESDLLKLDEQFTKTLRDKQQNKILVSHAAYGYWEQRYGIEQISVNGLSSNSVPSQKDLINIIEQAEQYDLQYMIFEQNVSETVSKRIQEEIGATTLILHNLAVRTEDDIENNEDFLTLMEHNIETIDQATK